MSKTFIGMSFLASIVSIPHGLGSPKSIDMMLAAVLFALYAIYLKEPR